MRYQLKVKTMEIYRDQVHFVVEGIFDAAHKLSRPKVILHFFHGLEDRRIPLVIKEIEHQEMTGEVSFCGDYVYSFKHLFYGGSGQAKEIDLYLNILYGDTYIEKVPVDLTPASLQLWDAQYGCEVKENHLHFFLLETKKKRHILAPLRKNGSWMRKKSGMVWRWFRSCGLTETSRRLVRVSKKYQFQQMYKRSCKKTKMHPNRISFISVRRDEMSGNPAFVYDRLKKDESLDLQVFFCTKDRVYMTREELAKMAELFASSRLIVVDEWTPFLGYITLRPETKVIQLWHACGAFKTFGFTRLGKPKGTKQHSRAHRDYDYATVSSSQVRMCYAEGFGVPTDHIVATGIPRTDVFFDTAYQQITRERLYGQYPFLVGKKVILFAPTFRGHVREDAYYPMEKFPIDSFMEGLPEDYVLLIKHHPFVTDTHSIPQAYCHQVVDVSADVEINDLLFVTDVIITDYSSLVFEASLLDIPMLFYVFDLEKYIVERDFYFDFETFVPGRFFDTLEQLQKAILEKDFDSHKMEAFKHKFFDHFDGKSTDRVVELIYHAMGDGVDNG